MKTEIYIIIVKTQGKFVNIPDFYYSQKAAQKQASRIEKQNPNTPVYIQRLEHAYFDE